MSYDKERYQNHRDAILARQRQDYHDNLEERRKTARQRAQTYTEARIAEVLQKKGGSCVACGDTLPMNPRNIFVAEHKGTTPLLTFCRKKITNRRLADTSLICANCREG